MRSLHDIASEYCAWVEHPATVPNLDAWLPGILAELVGAGFRAPSDGSADAGADDDYQRRDDRQVRAALPALPFQYYREIFDPLDLESAEEAVVGDLYDDLVDIYHDLSEGLFIYRQVSPAEAERYWSQSFGYHWGEHATSALRAFYGTLRPAPQDASRVTPTP